MPVLQQGVIVTLVLFIGGLVFHAGQLTARIDNIERTVERQHNELRGEIAELTKMLRAAISERRNWREEQT